MARSYIPVAIRRAVFERAKGRCEYCQSRADYATETFAVEHIIPVSRGGTDDLENLALACSGCNGHKYNRTEATDPSDEALVPLFHPRRQNWESHFEWSEDYSRLVGITSTGRATVEMLQMNSPGYVNLRRVLYLLGKHPPDFT